MTFQTRAARRTAVSVLLLLLVLTAGPAADAQVTPSTPEAVPRSRLTDAEAFFDALIPNQLAEHQIAGAAVALVQDGQIVVAKGYGLANVAEQRPVVAGETLFRIASVTKLFTWTAVMQLAEQGHLDLDADANTYLDFQIPATYPEPVTLRHLMSHSAGFEEWTIGIFVPTVDDLIPLSEWLPANMPARVRPVGTASSYSNYGAALAGYIVERVSGMPYEEYLETYILQPLGMLHTTARQPLPPELAPNLALGYAIVGGQFVTQPFDVNQAAPAGSMSTTATDMAAFMIAHLQDGRYGEARILGEATARQMHATSFRHDPRLSGFAHGFTEHERNGLRLLSHGGDFAFYRSSVDLLPDQGTGLFVTYNGQMRNGVDLRSELLQAFLDHYYPTMPEAVSPPPGFAQRAIPFTGQYRSNRHAYTTAEKVLLVVQPVYTIRAQEDLLVLTSPFQAQEMRFAEVEPLLFRQVDGPERLAFHQDAAGRVDLAFLESNPAVALERVAWYEMATLNQALLGLSLVLFLSVLVVALVRAIRQLRGKEGAGTQPTPARIARWTISVVAAVSWLFLLGTGLAVGRLMSSMGVDPVALGLMRVLIVLPVLAILLTVVSLVLLVPVWRRQYWRLSERIYYTSLVAAALAFSWFLLFWNLVAIT